MNIRCAFCQTPYTLSRVEMLDALQEMDAHNLTHYDAHCPRCRRATQIPRQKLEMAMPNWRQELKQFEAEMKAHPQPEAPLPTEESTEGARQAAPVAAAVAPSATASAKTGSTKSQTTRTRAGGKSKPAPRQSTAGAGPKKSNARKTGSKGSSKKSK